MIPIAGAVAGAVRRRAMRERAERPADLTGVCARGEHDDCSGQVYVGHGDRGAEYVPCRCPCHHALPKAA